MSAPIGSLLPVLAEAGVHAAGAPIRLAAGILAGGTRSVRRIRDLTADRIGVLATRLIDDVLRLALDGEVVDQVLERVQASGVAQRVAQRLLEDGTVERIVIRVAQGPELGRMLAVAIESEQTQRALTESLESEAAVRLIERLAYSPGSDRILAALLASPLLEEVVTKLLESDELWLLVDEIAQSPAVTAAITQQGRGFVEEVAERARERSRTADAWLERVARRRRSGTPTDDTTHAPLPETGSR